MKVLYRVLKYLYHQLREDPLVGHLNRGLKVGANFGLMEEVIIDYSHAWHITIGDDVTLAPRVHILAHDASTKRPLGYTRLGKVNIGNRVFVGAGSIILPGVTIGDDVIIGAGSVVARNVESGQVVAGNPAVFRCPTEEYLNRKKEEMATYPVFDASYTLSQGVTEAMKDDMNKKMVSRLGYVE